MAVIKAINSHASLARVINYITKTEKTDKSLIGGYNCRGTHALFEMKATKKMWRKTGGRQYKHFVHSFSPTENITLEQAHEIAAELAAAWEKLNGYEVCFATHKDRHHIHTHFVVNSVSFVNGKKFTYSKRDLQNFKDISDRILQSRGLSICQPSKNITSYNRYTYEQICKGESWLADIAIAVLTAKQTAKDKAEFISLLAAQQISVKWEDSRKYITFTNKDGKKVRNKKLTEIFKEDFTKEALLNDFGRNGTAAAIDEIERELGSREIDELVDEIERGEQEEQGESGGSGAIGADDFEPEQEDTDLDEEEERTRRRTYSYER